MKADIHPAYFPSAKVTCSCGNTFTMGSTKEEIHVEVCSACHPFYTGQDKIIDTAGRVEKFKARVVAAQKKSTPKAKAAPAPKKKVKK